MLPIHLRNVVRIVCLTTVSTSCHFGVPLVELQGAWQAQKARVLFISQPFGRPQVLWTLAGQQNHTPIGIC